MANKFKVISKEFLNQFRNFDFALADWTDNLSEFTERLQGNSGETLRLEEVLEVGTIVNEEEGTDQEFRLTDNIIRGQFYDYSVEGLYEGAAILIEFDNESISATVEGITNDGTDLIIDSAASTAIGLTKWGKDLIRTDVVIKVTTAPTFLLYKYGINPNERTSPNYLSPLDSAEQSYQLNSITGSFQTMRFSGNEIGSSLGVVQVKFDSTRESYKHQFTLTHEFIIPYYTEGDLVNLVEDLAVTEFKRNSSVKYGNGFFFGGDKNNTTLQFEDVGKIGNVGYFGQNFNGFQNFYAVENYAVANASSTGKIEVTEANTITFSITSSSPTGLNLGDEIILYHSKLPSATDYANQKTSFDSTWVTSKLKQTEGAGALASGVFTAVTVTLNAGKLDVSAVVTYSAVEQLLINDTDGVFIYFTIATNDISDPDNQDRANIVAFAGTPTKNSDVSGLATDWQPSIYTSSEFASGTAYTDLNGWDFDLNGQGFTFKTDVTQGALITKMIFHVAIDDGSTFHSLFSRNIPIGTPQTTVLFGEQFQILNIGETNNFNIASTEIINQVTLIAAIPLAPATEQTWVGGIGFQTPWRDWVQNLAIPPTFVDYNEPNDNLNEKASNYSGLLGFDIKTVLSVIISNTTGPDTQIDFLSDGSVIEDFGADVGTFSKNYRFFDSVGERSDLSKLEDTRVEIELAHTLGTLVVGDLEALVGIMPDQATVQPFFLSNKNNYLVPNSTLKPTDTLTTGNSTLLEITSTLDLVTLIFEVDKNKVNAGEDMNIYCSLKPV